MCCCLKTKHITRRTPSLQGSMGAAASCFSAAGTAALIWVDEYQLATNIKASAKKKKNNPLDEKEFPLQINNIPFKSLSQARRLRPSPVWCWGMMGSHNLCRLQSAVGPLPSLLTELMVSVSAEITTANSIIHSSFYFFFFLKSGFILQVAPLNQGMSEPVSWRSIPWSSTTTQLFFNNSLKICQNGWQPRCRRLLRKAGGLWLVFPNLREVWEWWLD